jgi:type II secretory pathway pseudopilin PulG
MKTRQTPHPAKQNKFTVLEFLIVVVIIAILSLLAVQFAGQGNAKAKAETVAQQISIVQQNVADRWRSSNFAAITCGGIAADNGFAGTGFVMVSLAAACVPLCTLGGAIGKPTCSKIGLISLGQVEVRTVSNQPIFKTRPTILCEST